jgi:hypothetical protein
MDFLTAIETLSPKDVLPLLQERFQANVLFFEKELPHLAPLLKQKTTDYHLYIDSRGVNIASSDGTLVYPVENGRSTLIQSSKLMAANLPKNPLWQKIFNQKGIVRYDEPTLPITTNLVNGILERFEQEDSFNNRTVYFGEKGALPTTSVLGIMSGLQLEYMRREYPYIHTLFVYEPIPDFFNISCHFVDYDALFKHLDDDRFYLFVKGHLSLHAVKKFYASNMVTNNYLRFELAPYQDKRIEDAKAVFYTIQRQNTRGWGTLDDEMVGLKNRMQNIDPKNPNYPMLTKNVDAGLPICIVGNGPSLNGLLPFIKANREKMIILSAGTALKPLKDYGIDPDFQVEIERRDHVAEVLADAPLGDTTLIAADLVDPSTLRAAQESLLFIRSASTSTTMNHPKKYLDYARPVVGNAAVAVALELGSELLLCGLDVGFKGDGKQHASGSFYDNRNDSSDEMIPTRGNFSGNIYTNSLFSLSREMFELAIASHKGVTVYNLSDGAYIQGAIPRKPEEINLPAADKTEALEIFKRAFSTDNVFSEFDTDYQSILETYIEKVFAQLQSVPVTSRRDLFEAIDRAYRMTVRQNSEENVTGILLSGTLSHVLNALFMTSMHMGKEDISELFAESVDKAREALLGALRKEKVFG